MKIIANLSRALVLVAVAAGPLCAEVTRIDVQSRVDLVGGQPFGAAGPYEKLSGRIYFAVDPALPANRIVADLDKAPRNAAGRVQKVRHQSPEPMQAARNGLILLAGIALGLLLNPITGPAVRRLLAHKLFGSGNGFAYQGNGSKS